MFIFLVEIQIKQIYSDTVGLFNKYTFKKKYFVG